MKTRINKILSVLAVVALVATSFVWAMPVAASVPGDGQFTIQDIPTATKGILLNGSSIVDIAVGADGKTVYVANVLAGSFIMKSTDAGQSFETVQNNYATVGGAAPVALSVAPDDVNTVAVTDGANVIISKDGGTTWAILPAPALGATGVITDIAVAPARSGTLLGREYVISIADGAAGVALGDVQIIGNTAAWATVGGAAPNAIVGVFDFTSVVVTPNFLGDRCVVAVGTKVAAASTALLIINTITNTVVVGSGVPVVGAPLLATGLTTEFGPAVATNIATSSIALPTNFDPTTSSGRRAYVGIASQGPAIPADNDVYRVDDTSARKLDAVTSAPVFSVAYNGTVDTGILFMGPRANNDVKYTAGMTSSSPTWTTTLKGPSGPPAPNVIVRVASDYATTSRLFAGTIGAESAFSVSNDAGVSFVGESLVNTPALGDPALSFTGDAKTVFLTAKDGNNWATIWQSAVPFDTTSWKRIFARALVTAANSCALSMSGTALFLYETTTVNGPIYVSQDGGVSFATRNGPTGVGNLTRATRDAQTVYYGDIAGVVYKSTNAGWTWATGITGGVGPIRSITLPKANQIIVGGTTGVAVSNDDGATFTTIPGGLTVVGTSRFSVLADSAYATNNIVYTTDTNTAASNIFRVNASATTNTWESMGNPQGAVTIIGITMRSGILYATSNNIAVGVVRSLYPTALIGDQNWQTVFNGLPAALAAGVGTTAGINLYGRVGATCYAFNDYLATTKPTLTSPADNYANAINPADGNGYAVDLKWKPMGTGTGQVNAVDIEIVDKANGFTGLATGTVIAISPTNPIVNTNNCVGAGGAGAFVLQPNKIYLWRVRAARTISGQLIDSPWSDPRTINIQSGSIVQQAYAGPVLLGPMGGAQNLDPNLVGFSWAPVSGATEYTVIVSTDPALTKAVSGTPAKVTVSAFQATGLAFDTTYFWAVQATKPTTSVQTVGTFRTMPKPVVAPTAPVVPVQPTIIVQAPVAETPSYIWAVIAIGAILVIAVIILIVRTRRVP